jgi:hypothetical protein
MDEGRQKQAARGKPRAAGAKKKTVSRGTAKLKTAADKKLKEHSEEIANSLYEKLIGGNIPCGKLLISLAEGQADGDNEAVGNRPRSMAGELASEPEWKGDEIDLESTDEAS